MYIELDEGGMQAGRESVKERGRMEDWRGSEERVHGRREQREGVRKR